MKNEINYQRHSNSSSWGNKVKETPIRLVSDGWSSDVKITWSMDQTINMFHLFFLGQNRIFSQNCTFYFFLVRVITKTKYYKSFALISSLFAPKLILKILLGNMQIHTVCQSSNHALWYGFPTETNRRLDTQQIPRRVFNTVLSIESIKLYLSNKESELCHTS